MLEIKLSTFRNERIGSLMAKRHTLFDSIFICRVHGGRAAETTPPFGIFALQQVPLAGARTQDLSAGGDLKSFRRRLFGFNAFRTSHK